MRARKYDLPSLLPPHFETPENISSTLIIQAHLIACIARAKGHDLRSEKLRAAICIYLLANAGADLLKPIGISAGTEIGFDLVHRLPTSVIKSLDEKIAVPLLALKVVPKWIILAPSKSKLEKFVIDTFDVGLTNVIGRYIQQLFWAAGVANAMDR